MKSPVRVWPSSVPRRSDSRSCNSARAWKMQSDGWPGRRSIRQRRPSAKGNWQRADSLPAARLRDDDLDMGYSIEESRPLTVCGWPVRHRKADWCKEEVGDTHTFPVCVANKGL